MCIVEMRYDISPILKVQSYAPFRLACHFNDDIYKTAQTPPAAEDDQAISSTLPINQ